MIKLAADELVVRETGGGYGTVDLRRLLDDLWAACADAGLHDPDLPNDVADVVSSYATRVDPAPTAEELDTLAARLLGDCGLHEAARCWCARRQRRALPALGEQVTLDTTTVRTRLTADSFFPEPPSADFVARVLEAAKGLGLQSCSAMLLREISRHLWLRDRESAASLVPPPPGEPANYWLIRPGDWATLLPPDRLTWLRRGALRPRPVSCLLPRVHVDVDLRRLLDAHAHQTDLSDLLLLPALDDLLKAAADVMEHIVDTLGEHLTDAEQANLAVGATVHGLATFAEVVSTPTPALLELTSRGLSAYRTIAVDCS